MSNSEQSSSYSSIVKTPKKNSSANQKSTLNKCSTPVSNSSVIKNPTVSKSSISVPKLETVKASVTSVPKQKYRHKCNPIAKRKREQSSDDIQLNEFFRFQPHKQINREVTPARKSKLRPSRIVDWSNTTVARLDKILAKLPSTSSSSNPEKRSKSCQTDQSTDDWLIDVFGQQVADEKAENSILADKLLAEVQKNSVLSDTVAKILRTGQKGVEKMLADEVLDQLNQGGQKAKNLLEVLLNVISICHSTSEKLSVRSLINSRLDSYDSTTTSTQTQVSVQVEVPGSAPRNYSSSITTRDSVDHGNYKECHRMPQGIRSSSKLPITYFKQKSKKRSPKNKKNSEVRKQWNNFQKNRIQDKNVPETKAVPRISQIEISVPSQNSSCISVPTQEIPHLINVDSSSKRNFKKFVESESNPINLDKLNISQLEEFDWSDRSIDYTKVDFSKIIPTPKVKTEAANDNSKSFILNSADEMSTAECEEIMNYEWKDNTSVKKEYFSDDNDN